MDDRSLFETNRAHFAWRVTDTMETAYDRMVASEKQIRTAIDQYNHDRVFFADMVETALATGMSVGRIAYHLKISIESLEEIMKGNNDGTRKKN